MFQRLPPAIATNTAPSFILMGYDTWENMYGKMPSNRWTISWETTGLKKDDFVPSVLDILVVGGKQYGIPMQYNLVLSVLEQDLVTRLDWTPMYRQKHGKRPWSSRSSSPIRARTNTVLVSPRKLLLCIGCPCSGVTVEKYFDTQTLEARINSPENIAALKVVQDAVVNHRVSPRNTRTRAGQHVLG